MAAGRLIRLARLGGIIAGLTAVALIPTSIASGVGVMPFAASSGDATVLASRCAGTRGILSATITNSGSGDATYALRANTLSPRRVVVPPRSTDEIVVRGVGDGIWRLVLNKNGMTVDSRTVTIECDPVDDHTGTVVSCLAGLGRVDVFVRNDNSERRAVTVTVRNGDRDYVRRFAVGGNDAGRATVTGLRDGPLGVTIDGIDVGSVDGYRFVDDVGCGPAAKEPAPILRVNPTETSQLRHEVSSFTQGLTFNDAGRLFESSGAYQDQTRVREIDPGTGAVVHQVGLGTDFFGEGLAAVGDTLWLLSWRQGIVRVLAQDTLDVTAQHSYDGEGWGLCYDGSTLIRSDGTAQLYRHRVDDFAVIETIAVRRSGEPVRRLNELECGDGYIWANVWLSDTIVRIDPHSGAVDFVVDVGALERPRPADSNAVANGIARDPVRGNVWLTGKLWTTYTRIELPSGLGG